MLLPQLAHLDFIYLACSDFSLVPRKRRLTNSGWQTRLIALNSQKPGRTWLQWLKKNKTKPQTHKQNQNQQNRKNPKNKNPKQNHANRQCKIMFMQD